MYITDNNPQRAYNPRSLRDCLSAEGMIPASEGV
jgi:hypothetical protein